VPIRSAGRGPFWGAVAPSGAATLVAMNVRPSELSHRDFYRILVTAVAPRPIAWVSTVSKAGHTNVAPYSFFNVVCAHPPLLGFSPALRQVEDGIAPKDTLSNLRETGEFVVNVVPYALTHAMNMTAGEYGPQEDEFAIAGLTVRDSQVVRVPQVAESPVSFECRVHQIMDFGTEPPSGSLVIGEIVSVFMAESAMKDGKLDASALDLIGRMGGLDYARTTERFALERPKK
jgi:flavin reductase (DIM6/NTAB) family NADH-FMN oxidoreductase RutF